MTTAEITTRAKKIVDEQLSYGNKVSLKWAKGVIIRSNEVLAHKEYIAGIRKNIENFLINQGLAFTFCAISETNGLSIYYQVNEVKYRFSDHSVTNIDRVFNEKHFDIVNFK